MTLCEMIASYPGLFYPQTWFIGEQFAKTPLPTWPRRMPSCVRDIAEADPASSPVTAAALAALYIEFPHDPIWRTRYLWTSDTDQFGQRVFVGDNGKGLEIHRHLHMTDRFGVPAWD